VWGGCVCSAQIQIRARVVAFFLSASSRRNFNSRVASKAAD